MLVLRSPAHRLQPPDADVSCETNGDNCDGDADTWVASSEDTLSAEPSEASDSPPHDPVAGQQGVSSDGGTVSEMQRKQPTAAILGSRLRQGAGRFGGAAKKVLVAETHALVKDAHELAWGLREGAQLTAQDTLYLSEKLVGTTKARVAASGGGLRGLLGSVYRSNGNSMPVSRQDDAMGPDGDMSAGAAWSPEASSLVARSPEAASLASSPPSGSPAPANPLLALSRGLAAQLGTTAVSTSPNTSPCKDPQGNDIEPVETNSNADPTLALFAMPARAGKPPSLEPSFLVDAVASPEVVASPMCRTPTDALERLLSGDSSSDSEDDEAQPFNATATMTSTASSPTAKTSPSLGDAETDLETTKAAPAPLAQRLFSLKGLRQGLQAAYTGGMSPVNSGSTHHELLGFSSGEELGGGDKAFLMLPSTLANYVEVTPSHGSEQSEAAASRESGTNAGAAAISPMQGNATLGARKASWALRTLQQARDIGGNLAAAAARGRTMSSHSQDDTVGCNGRGRAISTGNVEDSMFSIGAEDVDEDIFSEDAADHTSASPFPDVVPEGENEELGQEEVQLGDFEDEEEEYLFVGTCSFEEGAS